MSKHYLHAMFHLQSVAVIGASNRENSVGGVVFRNMMDNRFQGKLYVVNPNRD